VNLARARAGATLITVFVDPWAGRVMALRDPATYSAGERVIAWQRALHAGAGLGWPWRIIVFLSGFLPPLLTGSGVTMWLLKRRARIKRGAQGDPRHSLTERAEVMHRRQS
jgi:uncharacterized iron-regulated membrane protein